MAKPTAAAVEGARTIYARLRLLHPDAHCELDHTNPFELLVATVLSAQTTDKIVNQNTPALFARYPDAKSLAKANVEDVQQLLARIGMFRQKSKNIVALAQKLVEKHKGEVPKDMASLVELAGVGRKTANVVMGTVFDNAEGVVVDTHVQRLSQRLGWTKDKEPEDIEQRLMKLFPQADYAMLSHTLIFHGRRICFAQKPACLSCGVNDICPVAFKAELIGRKPKRVRVKLEKPAVKAVVKVTAKKAALVTAKPKKAVEKAAKGKTR